MTDKKSGASSTSRDSQISEEELLPIDDESQVDSEENSEPSGDEGGGNPPEIPNDEEGEVDPEKQEAAKTALSQWRSFYLGFMMAMFMGVPISVWGIQALGDNVTSVINFWLVVIVVFVLFVCLSTWVRKKLQEAMWVPAKEALTDIFAQARRLVVIFMTSADRSQVNREFWLLLRMVVAKYGWITFIIAMVGSGMTLLLTFSNLLTASLTWQNNRIMIRQNAKIQKQLENDARHRFHSELRQNFRMLVDKDRSKFLLAVSYFQYLKRVSFEEKKKLFLKKEKRAVLKKGEEKKTLYEQASKQIAITLLNSRGRAACRFLELVYQLEPTHNIAKFLDQFSLRDQFGVSREGRKGKFYHLQDVFCGSSNLKEGLWRYSIFNRTWSKSLKAGYETPINFSGIQMKDFVLDRSIWIGVKFNEAVLDDSSFKRARFDGVDFYKVNLNQAQFRWTDFINVKFTATRLKRAHFWGARLKKVSFSIAFMQGVYFSINSAINVTFSADCRLKGAYIAMHRVRSLRSLRLKNALCLYGKYAYAHSYRPSDCYHWHAYPEGHRVWKNLKEGRSENPPKHCPRILKGAVIMDTFEKNKKQGLCPKWLADRLDPDYKPTSRPAKKIRR